MEASLNLACVRLLINPLDPFSQNNDKVLTYKISRKTYPQDTPARQTKSITLPTIHGWLNLSMS